MDIRFFSKDIKTADLNPESPLSGYCYCIKDDVFHLASKADKQVIASFSCWLEVSTLIRKLAGAKDNETLEVENADIYGVFHAVA